MQTETKTTFGLPSLNKPTPKWATWFFRVFFYVTSMTTVALGMFTDIPVETKLHIAEWTAFGNIAVHAFTRMCGISIDVTDYSKP